MALAVQNIGMTDHPSLYCLLTDDSGHTMCLEDPINKVLLSNKPGFKYLQYFYICNLPLNSSAVTPKFVSFSFTSHVCNHHLQYQSLWCRIQEAQSKDLVSVFNHPCFR